MKYTLAKVKEGWGDVFNDLERREDLTLQQITHCAQKCFILIIVSSKF